MFKLVDEFDIFTAVMTAAEVKCDIFADSNICTLQGRELSKANLIRLDKALKALQYAGVVATVHRVAYNDKTYRLRVLVDWDTLDTNPNRADYKLVGFDHDLLSLS